jgi:hypothetical protein
MIRCAETCNADHVLLLEDDWELITEPRELARHRIQVALDLLVAAECSEAPGSPPLLGVHLRHKLFFGAPFYELLTSAQHNEPPSAYTAWYFSADPVASKFPDGLWLPPFWDSQGICDSNRWSWLHALRQQSNAAEAHAKTRNRSFFDPPLDWDGNSSRVWWCFDGSSLLCTSTAAHHDHFRTLMYSTNPMLYRTRLWRLHFASYAAILQDLRAMEETISASFSWRVNPSFVVALSMGVFRHYRLDRQRMPHPSQDEAAAVCSRQRTV